jgi:rSAM/selenodomain-associated transferase 1
MKAFGNRICESRADHGQDGQETSASLAAPSGGCRCVPAQLETQVGSLIPEGDRLSPTRASMPFLDARILVFAKAPVPGQVKTRLFPSLSPGAAAVLHGELVADTLERLSTVSVAPVELWCFRDPELPFFSDLARRYSVGLHRQEGADLGERMRRAAAHGLERCSRLVLVGTDCPALCAEYVAEALDALSENDAVLGPAEDGGYVLLGLRRAESSLFTGIPWGTEEVARLTRERMRTLGWTCTELATLWDLDRPEDLLRYREMMSGRPEDVVPGT